MAHAVLEEQDEHAVRRRHRQEVHQHGLDRQHDRAERPQQQEVADHEDGQDQPREGAVGLGQEVHAEGGRAREHDVAGRERRGRACTIRGSGAPGRWPPSSRSRYSRRRGSGRSGWSGRAGWPGAPSPPAPAPARPPSWRRWHGRRAAPPSAAAPLRVIAGLQRAPRRAGVDHDLLRRQRSRAEGPLEHEQPVGGVACRRARRGCRRRSPRAGAPGRRARASPQRRRSGREPDGA